VLQVSEAEAMVAGGITNVLVSNEVVSPRKLQRLVALAAQGELLFEAVAPNGRCVP
jgi:3-hydroxy-D-aspartate aldolase